MKRKWTTEQLRAEVRDHPVRVFFFCPLGRGWDDIQLWELGDAAIQIFTAVYDLAAVVVLLLWQRLILRGLLRPFYKAYLIRKYREEVLKEEKRYDRK